MASDPHTLERLRRALQIRKVESYEKRMFGGVCFMVDDKMCFGTYKSGIMFRVDPELTAQLVVREGVDQMEQGGHSMKGFMLVEPHAYDRDEDMDFWIDLCLAYNPKANAAKKKKAKI
jgi:TfoX/Sxy family transcriptional regulator of competence genes